MKNALFAHFSWSQKTLSEQTIGINAAKVAPDVP